MIDMDLEKEEEEEEKGRQTTDKEKKDKQHINSAAFGIHYTINGVRPVPSRATNPFYQRIFLLLCISSKPSTRSKGLAEELWAFVCGTT